MKMGIKVGLNGFGRIGRVVFRTCFYNSELEILAINDPAVSVDYMCYLIKFDSTHGKFLNEVTCTKNEILLDGRTIKIYQEKLPSCIPWQECGVEYVIEASGMFNCLQNASGHLENECVKRVIVTAPCVDIPMVIIGVNDSMLKSDVRVISCASSTLYCLAPIIKILEDNYGVEEGFITSIHAMTPSLKPLDGLCMKGKHWRDHRSIHQNIIPAATGACKALGKIIPQVKDKLIGMAFRVPIVNVSVLDITIRLKSQTSLHDIIRKVDEENKSEAMRNIIATSKEQTVSSDFARDSHSCTLDVNSCLQLKPNFFKLICWYENEYSYACRIIDSIIFSEKQFKMCPHYINKLTIEDSINLKADKDKLLMRPCDFPKTIVKQNFEVLEQPPSLYVNKLPTNLLTSNISDLKSKYDVMKLWKDDYRILTQVIHPTSSLSFPRTENQNKEITNTLTNENQLEKVKQEISKIVNITKKILNKSGTKTELGSHNKKDSYNILEFEKCTNEVATQISSKFDAEDTNYSNKINMNEDSPNSNNAMPSDDKLVSCVLTHDAALTSKSPTVCLASGFVPSDRTARSTGKSKNDFIEYLISYNNYSDETPKADTVTNYEVKVPKTKKSQDIEQNPSSLMYYEKIYRNNEINIPLRQQSRSLSNENNQNIYPKASSKIIKLGEELRKYNIVRIDKELKTQKGFHKILPEQNHISCYSDKKTNSSIDLENRRFEERIFVPESNVSKRSSLGNTTITTVSNRDMNLRKLDIYDKIDSASVTDSENSFSLCKKKSEVISFSDLINSLDDIMRLDKICKIIETSDDLSDKLFSRLDQVCSNKQQETEWSLKDLCERLNLDEFCNQISDNTSS